MDANLDKCKRSRSEMMMRKTEDDDNNCSVYTRKFACLLLVFSQLAVLAFLLLLPFLFS